MGSFLSKKPKEDVRLRTIRERNHPKLFYKGMDAALEGRYTESELCFHRIIFQHPKFLNHTKILVMMDDLMRRRSELREAMEQAQANRFDASFTDTANGAPSVDPSVNTAAGAETVFTADSSNRGEDFQSVTVTAAPSAPIIEHRLSTGKELTSMLDFLQVQQDIENIYLVCNTPRADQLAMVYAEFNCVWMQLMLHCMQLLTTEQNETREMEAHTSFDQTTTSALGSTDPLFRTRRSTVVSTRMKRKAATTEEVEGFIELYGQTFRYFLMSSAVNYGTLALYYAAKLGSTGQCSRPRSNSSSHGALAGPPELTRRQQRVFNNIVELCEAIAEVVLQAASESSEEYISRVLFKVMPAHLIRGSRRHTSVAFDEAPLCANNSIPTVFKDRNEACTDEQLEGEQMSPITTHDQPLFSTPDNTTDDSGNDCEHLFSHLTKLCVAYSKGQGGGTFLVESRICTPASSVVMPLRHLNLPLRLVLPTDPPISKADVELLESPHRRVSWQSTAWTLPPSAVVSGHAYPMTSQFLLCTAFPEYYSMVGTTARYTMQRKPTAETAQQNPAAEAPSRSLAQMDESIHNLMKQAEAGLAMAASKMSSNERPMSAINPDIDVNDPRLRRGACMDETATCMKLMYVLLAKLYKFAGSGEESRACALAAVQQTVCLRGPDSEDAHQMYAMVREMGLV